MAEVVVEGESIPEDETTVPCDHHLGTHTHTRHTKCETPGVEATGLCLNELSRRYSDAYSILRTTVLRL